MPTPLVATATVTESPVSGIAWAAIIAGAFAAAALSLILLALGAGIGLSSASPWPGSGAAATTFTVGAAVWLIIVQWLSSGLGGYLTGRLRTKWVGMHTDEVFFRDTAHGFLTWGVAAVVAAAFLSSAASSIVGGSARVAGGVASAAVGASEGAAQQAGNGGLTGYYVDALYRSDRPNTNAADTRAETARIFGRAAVNGGTLPDNDKAYLSQLVAAQTGLSKDDAAKRVNDVLSQEQAAEAKVRQVADETRKAGAKLSFYFFVSMLIGAFIASVGGALGGRHRDEN